MAGDRGGEEKGAVEMGAIGVYSVAFDPKSGLACMYQLFANNETIMYQTCSLSPKKCCDGTEVPVGASFFDWCSSFFCNNSAEANCRVAAICWAVWGAKKNLVWKGKAFVNGDIVAFAYQYLDQWKCAKKCMDLSWPFIRAFDCVKHWTLPQANSIKVNVNAALFEGGRSFGSGIVARNSASLLVEGWTKLSSGQVDVIGVCEVLSWLKGRSWTYVFVEIDSLCRVQALQSSINIIYLFGLVILDCKVLFAS
uniref:RNase H type-1 domain-containing protein n=1 Tax=Cannabis sativa TaxID=3483 RepID=A0A803QM33_CANSA